jgi:hypothetical protein
VAHERGALVVALPAKAARGGEGADPHVAAGVARGLDQPARSGRELEVDHARVRAAEPDLALGDDADRPPGEVEPEAAQAQPRGRDADARAQRQPVGAQDRALVLGEDRDARLGPALGAHRARRAREHQADARERQREQRHARESRPASRPPGHPHAHFASATRSRRRTAEPLWPL